ETARVWQRCRRLSSRIVCRLVNISICARNLSSNRRRYESSTRARISHSTPAVTMTTVAIMDSTRRAMKLKRGIAWRGKGVRRSGPVWRTAGDHVTEMGRALLLLGSVELVLLRGEDLLQGFQLFFLSLLEK